MQTDRTHAVTQELMVARTCAELAQEAEAKGSFPRHLAASLAGAASDAAASLKVFLSSTRADTMPPDLVHRSFQAHSDLAAIAQFAGLVLTYTSTPRDAAYLSKIVRHTANHAVECLNHVEEAIYR
ncbi:hypothetical protein DVT68_14730 [Dyella solisilvae]|uniref:Uncharacterized protein n=1 Tax=Dyella solisilvae TaxID=1920168 RepID=A0A370K6A2_9GAMM|nr:hypothetical protein [Dyella solisilvae]RDI97550.1 hypothetical protein DVT68_14730 [Dyella solisilvae]